MLDVERAGSDFFNMQTASIFSVTSLASALRYETLAIPNLFFQYVFPVSTQRP